MASPFPQPMPGMMPPGMPPGGMPPPPGGGPAGGIPPGPPPPAPEAPPMDPLLAMLAAVAQRLADGQEQEIKDELAALDSGTLAALRDVAESDPAATDILLPLLPPEEEREPVYPSWFTPPPKPSRDDVEQALDSGRGYWQDTWEVRVAEDLDIYTQEKFGAFKNFKKNHDEEYRSPALINDLESSVSSVGTAVYRYRVPVYTPELNDEAQKVEDALLYWDKLSERAYRRRGNNDFRADLIRYWGITGYVMSPCIFNPMDGEMPFIEDLVDPTTCFPMWDAHGLAVMVRDYSDAIAHVVADYDMGDGKVRDALSRKINKNTKKPHTWRDQVRVMAYWDRWWYGCWVDDIEIVPMTAHRYGFVPWLAEGSGMGEPVAITGRFLNQVTPADLSGAQMRIHQKHASHFTKRKRLHIAMEAAIGKAFTLWSFVDQPAWMVIQDPATDAAGAPKIVNEANKVNTFKQGEQVAPLNPATINPGVAQTVFSALGQDKATSYKPPAFYGVFESANQSGNATEGALEAGKDKDTPYILATQSFLEARAELRLKIWRDWGHLVEGRSGEMGVMRIPYQDRRRKRADTPAFDLTPEMIDEVGTMVECQLTTLRMQNLGPLGNAAAIWLSNGIMSKHEAIDLRGAFDPEDVLDEIEYEAIIADPELMKLHKYRRLRERDPELAALYLNMLMQQSQPQPPNPMAALGAGGPPPGPPQGGPMSPNTSQMGMPQMGMPQQGPTGRPAGGMMPGGMAPGVEP